MCINSATGLLASVITTSGNPLRPPPSSSTATASPHPLSRLVFVCAPPMWSSVCITVRPPAASVHSSSSAPSGVCAHSYMSHLEIHVLYWPVLSTPSSRLTTRRALPSSPTCSSHDPTMDSTYGSQRGGRSDGHDVLPASQYLQERLQERRARNTRPARTRQSDFGPRKGRDDDIFYDEALRTNCRTFDSSPLSVISKGGSESGAGKDNRRRTLGVRDVNEQLDRLNKENFALKLELDHRRDATTKLQEQIDNMMDQFDKTQLLKKEHGELLQINGQLVTELERRDQAVEEAVDTINDLEDENTDLKAEVAVLKERLETRTSTTRPSTANADSGYAGTETNEQAPPSSPPEPSIAPKTPSARPAPLAPSAASHKLFSALNAGTPAKIRREPAILSQKKASTQALRRVFLEASTDLHPVKSFNSLLSKREQQPGDEEAVLDSPRLSVLSESSFPSLYSPKKHLSPDRYGWEDGDGASAEQLNSHFRQDSINRVSQWISGGDLPEETPSKIKRLSLPISESTLRGMSNTPVPTIQEDHQFQSLDAVSTAPNATSQATSFVQPYPLHRQKTRLKQLKTVGIDGSVFGEPLLPPTPDSVSTRMLRGSRSSIAGDRSILDTTPAPIKGYAPLEPGLRTAPRQMRSSVELKSAYFTNLKYRKDHFAGNQNDDSSSDGDETQTMDVKNHSSAYDGFPDGNSILMGTPSRFLHHGKELPNVPVFFDAGDMSPPPPARDFTRRRLSSCGMSTAPRKPSFGRAETSPNFFGTIGRLVSSASKSTMGSVNSGSKSSSEGANVTSPRSTQSTSTGARTVVHPIEHIGAMSPEPAPARRRTSASPAPTFSQKTQKLLRRMSNSHAERELPRSPREKSPLPTLTSTPSSAYVNTIPINLRRPSTAEAARQSMHSSTTPRPPSSHKERRPSMSGRTKTAPAPQPPSTDHTVDKKSFFKRSSSVKNATVVPSPVPASASAMSDKNAAAARGGVSKRRGSMKDAAGNNMPRRGWRGQV
nr:hypothetical protein CFP56_37220 [Quercus suber]